jgi:hypothetical protein
VHAPHRWRHCGAGAGGVKARAAAVIRAYMTADLQLRAQDGWRRIAA